VLTIALSVFVCIATAIYSFREVVQQYVVVKKLVFGHLNIAMIVTVLIALLKLKFTKITPAIIQYPRLSKHKKLQLVALS